MKIYSMKGLAQHENVTHDHLRSVVSKFKAGKIDKWRDYRFFGIDGKCWFAYPKGEDIEFFDGSQSESEEQANQSQESSPDE